MADFENIAAYSGTVVAATGDTAEISTVAGSTGNAMQVVYNLVGNQTYVGSGYRSWGMAASVAEFSTPLDLSKAEGFRIKVKSTGIDNMSAFFYLTDKYGKIMRLNMGQVLKNTDGTWADWKVPFATQKLNGTTYWPDAPYGFGLQNSVWLNGGVSIDLANITKITMNIYDVGATKTDETVTFAFDDLYAYQDGPTYKTVLHEVDFNSYADEAAMKAEWSLYGSNATITLGTASDGKKALAVADSKLTAFVNKGVSKNLAAPIDLSTLAYAAVELEGDAAYTGFGPLLALNLLDANDKVCAALGNSLAVSPTRGVAFMPLNTSGLANVNNYGSACWRAGTYAANSVANLDMNLATVKTIRVMVSPQGGTIPTDATAGFKIKKITFGGTSLMPAAANVSDWSQF